MATWGSDSEINTRVVRACENESEINILIMRVH